MCRSKRRKRWERANPRPPVIGLQEQVTNHRMRLGSKAPVVSDTGKGAAKRQVWVTDANTSEPPFKCRKRMKTTSKPCMRPDTGQAWRKPADWPCGVRHRGGANVIRALALNCGNLRSRCQRKGTSPGKGEADSTDARSRDGAPRSSVEAAVMAAERRGRILRSEVDANCTIRRSVCR